MRADSLTLSTALRWNATARSLVGQYGTDPVTASRVYFVLSVAHVLALPDDDPADSDDALAAQLVELASVRTLSELFPMDHDLAALALRMRPQFDSSGHGPAAVQSFLRKRRGDGAARKGAVQPPQDDRQWRTLENRPSVKPMWGLVKPFGVDLDGLRLCPPPPEPGSAEHLLQLKEVRDAVENVTDEQLRKIFYWSCSIGGEAPSGRWQLILENELTRMGVATQEALYVLALATSAMFNAGIGCWRSKYEFWYPRPANADPQLPLWIQLPNFPSYTSGHAAFSWAVAGALDDVLPEARQLIHRRAQEAGDSRVHAGIHYRCDCEGGTQTGLIVGSHTARCLPTLSSVRQLAAA